MIRGQIVKETGGRFFVKTDDGERMVCSARGKLKEKGELYVGDIVFVDDDGSPVIALLQPPSIFTNRGRNVICPPWRDVPT